MKKALFFLAIVVYMITGCSKTWSGIKQDTKEVYHDTKEVIHDATSPSYEKPIKKISTKQEGIEVPEREEVESSLETKYQ